MQSRISWRLTETRIDIELKTGRIELDIYLTLAPCGAQEINCAKQLRDFAEEYNFELNIKAAAPYHESEEELSYLMTSKYCTVEAFTVEDYRNLAGYLGFQDNWNHTQVMKEKDEKMQHNLEQIQYSEFDYTKYYSMQILK